MKCLFVLREKKGGKPIVGQEFDNKMKAKEVRNALGGTTVVSLGRDHKNYDASKAEK